MQTAIKPSRAVVLTTLLLILGAALTGCTTSKGDTAAEKRDYVDLMTKSSLKAFYAADKDLESQVEQAAGYGLFSSIGTNLIFVATEGGHGKVHNNKTGEDTYMKVAGGGIGLGIGVKDYKLLMVFKSEFALDDFVANGWSANAEADVAAKSGDQGGAKNAGSNTDRDVDTHILTESGLSVSATIGATKFYKDNGLN